MIASSRRMLTVCSLLLPLTFSVSGARGEETVAERRTRLEHMDAQQREQLSQSYERFRHLEPEDRERLRRLHADIEAAPDRDELRQVMDRYHEWLNELPASQRMMLAALPADERLEKIDEIRSTRGQRMRLSPADLQQVQAWIKTHNLEAKWSEARQGNRRPDVDPKLWAELREKLSEPARKMLDDAKSIEERRWMLLSWVFQASRAGGRGGPRTGLRRPSDQEMQEFLKSGLTDKQQAMLSALPQDEMRRELHRLWREKHARPGDESRDRPEGRPFGPLRERGGPKSVNEQK